MAARLMQIAPITSDQPLRGLLSDEVSAEGDEESNIGLIP